MTVLILVGFAEITRWQKKQTRTAPVLPMYAPNDPTRTRFFYDVPLVETPPPAYVPREVMHEPPVYRPFYPETPAPAYVAEEHGEMGAETRR